MPHFTAQCGYHAHYATTVHVEAPDLETACVLAVEAANSTELWTTTDHCGDTFVDAIAEGDHAHPWGPGALPVPAGFTERGEPPAITITAEENYDDAVDQARHVLGKLFRIEDYPSK